MITAIAAIIMFSLLIMFHEGGHFLAAKSAGIKVNEFSIGMGPKIFSKKSGDTTYSLRILPIGGYVAMEGEDGESSDPASFQKASVWNRMKVVLAGAFTNFVLAFIIFAILNLSAGMLTTTIGELSPDYPAFESGMLVGDKIIKINDKEIDEWTDIINAFSDIKEGDSVKVLAIRVGEEISLNMKAKEMDGRSVIGVKPEVSHNFFRALKEAFSFIIKMIQLMFLFLHNLVRGAVTKNDVAGPIGVISEVGKAAANGWQHLLLLMGFLNVNLGFFNLLPIPALDGSRFMFLLIETLRGKPINPEKEAIVHFIGFIILMVLMAYILFLDLGKLGVL
ncbi:MAG: site-2 protease family protein [Tissierellia bacterium]|nr:site-2 protease family protein [Tissierellia bacterium]